MLRLSLLLALGLAACAKRAPPAYQRLEPTGWPDGAGTEFLRHLPAPPEPAPPPEWVEADLVGTVEFGGGDCTRQPCRAEDPPDCPCATSLALTVTKGKFAGAKVFFHAWYFGCRGDHGAFPVRCPFKQGAVLEVRASIVCVRSGVCIGRKLPEEAR